MRQSLIAALAGLVLAVPMSAPAEPAALDITTERTASASWIRFERVRYVITVVEHSQTSASTATGVEARRGYGGDVVAAVELCEPDLSSCARGQTWVGSLGSGITNGVTFDADPVLRGATLTGHLREVDGSNACSFTVRWASADEPAPVIADPVIDPSETRLSAIMARMATASVTSSCWRTHQNPDFLSGSGRLDVRHEVIAAG